ncbi:MAG: hypothetical protein JSR39_05535 [Verrucomicrobia bacterium]|nr:hypothetical protein [Verrucomicrobiota bacterium]
MIITKKRRKIHFKYPSARKQESQLDLLHKQLRLEKSGMLLQVFRNCLHFQPAEKRETKTCKNTIKEPLQSIHKELLDLFALPHLAKEHRFLSRFAIRVQQLNHDAIRARRLPKMRKVAEQVLHYLNTPMGAPFVIRTSLVQAAITFSEQDPHLSDLSEILQEMAKYGPKFNLQLLRIFSLG